MYHLRVPQTEEELERYYQFRWEMLRKPLHQPKGSERDAWDAMAHHQMVVDEQGNLVAVGRLYINADNEASIRFMAVHPDVQDKGLGTLMAMTLAPASWARRSSCVCSAALRPDVAAAANVIAAVTRRIKTVGTRAAHADVQASRSSEPPLTAQSPGQDEKRRTDRAWRRSTPRTPPSPLWSYDPGPPPH